ncbi:GNAT family N-acetyltransferase [Alcaligenes ammonioxydans]|jgi:GNAT superfamily N-acetyltransferase|uniref:GNAT family N-acetyltransferase n=1 Tax=Alcaligenes ammonioxydans TaxID=2582914 RepID=A0ABX8SPE4_9BURK|nr:GNAT family N-acetyltransferase [Alcaligenes ammonioxydans]EJC62055.1 acetyltransferase, GnaT family protein [Alcaligenes faecalis subsp. faecalis NCIB 8687]QBH19878.1 GNAT family N-acetyltransferase [Alcaligenes faecalis]MCH1879043.1 GNAT family N-acetyltransferase [Alcaligenes ammonioxydans]QXX77880.1 GNAT family N-acetyltransferase [Alcaligenes ammonioxydans]WGQ35938.1 GNAT family N-acetyltransferase [Alcaligenes faecalis]
MSEFIKGYVLRPATPADIPAILGLMRDMASFEKLEHIFKASAESLRNSFFSDEPSAYCLVITPEGQPDTIISYIMWFYNYSSFLDRRGIYLEDLYIDPAHRKKGLGAAALRHLAQMAVTQGCGRLEWVVLDWNQNAIDFYQHQGAQVLQDWRVVRVTGEALVNMANGTPVPAEAQG